MSGERKLSLVKLCAYGAEFGFLLWGAYPVLIGLVVLFIGADEKASLPSSVSIEAFGIMTGITAIIGAVIGSSLAAVLWFGRPGLRPMVGPWRFFRLLFRAYIGFFISSHVWGLLYARLMVFPVEFYNRASGTSNDWVLLWIVAYALTMVYFTYASFRKGAEKMEKGLEPE